MSIALLEWEIPLDSPLLYIYAYPPYLLSHTWTRAPDVSRDAGLHRADFEIHGSHSYHLNTQPTYHPIKLYCFAGNLFIMAKARAHSIPS